MGYENDKIPFGERVRALRKQNGWTQAQLAEKISEQMGEGGAVETRTIGRWEQWYLEPQLSLTTRNLLNLCRVLECDIEYLMGEIDTPRKETTDIQAALGVSAAAVLKIQQLPQRKKEVLSLLLLDPRFDEALQWIAAAFSSAMGEDLPKEFEFEPKWNDFNSIKEGAKAWGCYVLPRKETVEFRISTAGRDFIEAARNIMEVVAGGNS